MRHAAARQDHGLQAERRDGARHRLAELVAALHGGLRRQVGVDVDRQHRIGVAEMGERDADRVVDLGGRGEGRIEILPVELAHDLEADLARHFPVKLAAGEFAGRLAADMDGERRRGGVEELLGVVVGEDDPQVGLVRAQPLADVGRDLRAPAATTFLSSVSGMVKNCGACGSIAPPITVDIMAFLLVRRAIGADARLFGSQIIAQLAATTSARPRIGSAADRASQPDAKQVRSARHEPGIVDRLIRVIPAPRIRTCTGSGSPAFAETSGRTSRASSEETSWSTCR